jgi:hypothetical protein
MTPAERKAALILKGAAHHRIAAKARVSGGTVSRVIHGQARHARVERVVSEILGLAQEDVFGPAPVPRRRLVGSARKSA